MTRNALDTAADAGSREVMGILFIDNHPLFRATVEQYLRHGGDGEVHFVGLSATGDVLPVAAAFRPQIILIDIADPSGSGLDMVRALRRLLPDAAIAGMGWEDSAVHQQEARAAGADLFLRKDRLNTTLFPAVKALAGLTLAKQLS